MQAQAPSESLNKITHSASFEFLNRNGECLRANITAADKDTITIQTLRQPLAILQRKDVLQISQGNALLYSARSSWKDVKDADVEPRETFVITMRNGKRVKGIPSKVLSDSIALRQPFKTTTYPKVDIATIDYLRLKPATDGFNLALEEAPYALIFYPEFYYRIAGLEGRIPVRLYDASKSEDNSSGVAGCFR